MERHRNREARDAVYVCMGLFGTVGGGGGGGGVRL